MTQSTSETPSGPLTLRVFPPVAIPNLPAEPCAGEVYTDDGHTFNFRQGEFARIHFTCSLSPDGGVTVHVDKQHGTWKPWWHEYRIEVVGLSSSTTQASLGKQRLAMTSVDSRYGAVVPALESPLDISFR